MPRNTAKSKRCNNDSSRSLQTTSSPAITNVVSKKTSSVPKRGRVVKNEHGSITETVTEQVFHRKSERRRVARDIFLVFEEQTRTRGSKRSNKKQSKPKFGHLNVEDPLKPKGLLRDIKNEPKCYLSKNVVAEKSVRSEKTKRNFLEKDKSSHPHTWSSCMSICSKLNNVEIPRDVQQHSNAIEPPIIARVNPIFLWAKQDNSRIIEVRCEDYDKRNRIRLTKTSNGWRAIPRSDPTSTKVLKFYSSPLVKVKRETLNNNIANQITHVPTSKFPPESKQPFECSNFDTSSIVNEISLKELSLETGKSSLERKSKNKKTKKRKKTIGCKKIALCTNTTTIGKDQLPMVASVEISTNKDCYKKDICLVERTIAKVKEDLTTNELPAPEQVIKDTSQTAMVPPETMSQGENSAALDDYDRKVFHDEYSFQLCPKTGLFLRNSYGNFEKSADDELQIIECNSSTTYLDIDREKKNDTERKRNSIEENHDSLEAKTKNLKDLLDEADLLQHCDDNANSDADLVDSLVKTSCENNLLHDNATNHKQSLEPTKNKDMCEAPTGDEDLAQLIDVSEPPKCLSFNEAGEIEALNCELFQSNTFMETFEEQTPISISDKELTAHTVSNVQTMSHMESLIQDNFGNSLDIVTNEDSPKDLSYKKREEVCPPSESRSQCAVTSSSDVIKSPKLDESSALASTSETLKNLILEQFIKLNTITNHNQNHIDLDKKTNSVVHINSIYEKVTKIPQNGIETVVIDDDENAADPVNNGDSEPLKKRLRSNPGITQNSAESEIQAKMVMIDKDPDPLTQLRLLIQNSQWKVPDPILVPKDRLSAVLASPAREIPLLITTRPELRLPEAFAYPEIIQNPNILVISMAQLEAILSNDPDINKVKDANQEFAQPSSLYVKQNPIQNLNFVKDFHAQKRQAKQIHNLNSLHQRDNTSILSNPTHSLAKEDSLHNEQSMPSEINAATMAVLNQMLWLPYFGQISQDFIKSFKPLNNFTEKMASLLPFCGQKSLEGMCEKNTQTQVSSLQQEHVDNSNGHFGSGNHSSALKQGQTEEIALYQKVLHHQMQNVFKNNTAKNSTLDRQNNSSNHSFVEQNTHFEEYTNNKLNIRSTNNNNTNLLKNNKSERETFCSIGDTGNKSYNLRSSIASRQSSESSNNFNIRSQNTDNKPRVTCKSLLNLLDPEHSQSHNLDLNSINSKPVVSLEKSLLHDTNGLKKHSMDNNCERNRDLSKEYKFKLLGRQNNPNITDKINKQNNKLVEDTSSQTVVRNVDISLPPTETSVPLWHPLFGSNSKSAYSSPWQWTTVTAAGE